MSGGLLIINRGSYFLPISKFKKQLNKNVGFGFVGLVELTVS